MTKAELISALEWFKDDAELHIVVPHEALSGIHEVLLLDSARYNLIPPRVELVAARPTLETKVLPEVWLIRKRGYWYRPNRAGYTSSIDEAGRYTEAEAKAEAAIEPEIMQAIPWSQALDEHLAASAENRSAD